MLASLEATCKTVQRRRGAEVISRWGAPAVEDALSEFLEAGRRQLFVQLVLLAGVHIERHHLLATENFRPQKSYNRLPKSPRLGSGIRTALLTDSQGCFVVNTVLVHVAAVTHTCSSLASVFSPKKSVMASALSLPRVVVTNMSLPFVLLCASLMAFTASLSAATCFSEPTSNICTRQARVGAATAANRLLYALLLSAPLPRPTGALKMNKYTDKCRDYDIVLRRVL